MDRGLLNALTGIAVLLIVVVLILKLVAYL